MEFIRENFVKILLFLGGLIIVIIIFSLLFGRRGIANKVTYTTLEQRMVQAAKKYANDNKKILPTKENETNKINLDTLVNSNYIDEMTAIEDKNVKCSGNVHLSYKNNDVMYVPYLKCGKYHETKTLSDFIKDSETIVSSNDGLYKYGDMYVYRGENPNNYIIIGNRVYRIIEINENGELRLISNKRLDRYFVWDNRYNAEKQQSVGINDYLKSRLKESFDYIIKNNNFDEDAGTDYTIFSEQEKEKIIKHDICIGKRSLSDGTISSENECKVVDKDQYLSLMTVSDYARASIDPNCKSIYDKSCLNYNYLSQISDSFRTITATSDNSYQVFYIDEGVADLTRASNTFSVYPVVYLDNTSLYQQGDGSLENPYYIR